MKLCKYYYQSGKRLEVRYLYTKEGFADEKKDDNGDDGLLFACITVSMQ